MSNEDPAVLRVTGLDHEPPWSYGARMDVGVLGPLRVADAAGEVRLQGAKERTLLAVLAAHADQVVAPDDLVDALWPDEPPRTAIRTLQVYIARLRSALARDDSTASSCHRDCWPRVPAGGRSDGGRRQQVPQPGGAGPLGLAEGQPAVAADTFTEALGLWRGPAYSGFEEARVRPLRGAAARPSCGSRRRRGRGRRGRRRGMPGGRSPSSRRT